MTHCVIITPLAYDIAVSEGLLLTQHLRAEKQLLLILYYSNRMDVITNAYQDTE